MARAHSMEHAPATRFSMERTVHWQISTAAWAFTATAQGMALAWIQRSISGGLALAVCRTCGHGRRLPDI